MSWWSRFCRDIRDAADDVVHVVVEIEDDTEEYYETVAHSLECAYNTIYHDALNDFKLAVNKVENLAEDLTVDTFSTLWSAVNTICINCLAPLGPVGYYVKIVAGGVGVVLAKSADGWVTVSNDLKSDFQNYIVTQEWNAVARLLSSIELSEYSGYEGSVTFSTKPVIAVDTPGVDHVTFGYAGSIYFSQGGADVITLSQVQPLPGLFTLTNNITLSARTDKSLVTILNTAGSDNIQLKSSISSNTGLAYAPGLDCEGYLSSSLVTCACGLTVNSQFVNVPWGPGSNGTAPNAQTSCNINSPMMSFPNALNVLTLSALFDSIEEGGISIYSPAQPFYIMVQTPAITSDDNIVLSFISCTTPSSCDSASPENYHNCMVTGENCFFAASIELGDGQYPQLNVFPDFII